MTPQIAFLFLLLAGMVFLFLTEKIAVDLTAFLGLVILIFAGFVGAEDAFTGFASSAVITMLSIFIVSASLLETGIADLVGDRVHRWVGSNETVLIVTIMLVAAILSAFMNNIAAAAVLMPAVASLARQAGLSPSRLFMPLAFGAILGGTTTLVGTPPNILAGAMLESRGMETFGLFDFTAVGSVLVGVGVLFMVTIGRRLLPKRETGPSPERKLADVYELDEMLFSFRIPEDSALDGSTLEKARLGEEFDAQVVAVLRDGQKQLAPESDFVLNSGDMVLVGGKPADFQDLLRLQGLEIKKVGAEQLPRLSGGVSAVRVQVAGESGFLGRSVRDLDLGSRVGVLVVAIERGSEVIRERLGEEIILNGDEIVAIGTQAAVDKLASLSGFVTVQSGLEALRNLREQLFVLKVSQESPLAGSTLGASRLGELIGLTVGGIVREGETHLGMSSDEVIHVGDELLVAGEPRQITNILRLGDIRIDATAAARELESQDVAMVEVALAPRSSLVGKTLLDVSFRQRYGFRVLAVWREGDPIRSNLARLTLNFGDALLLQGPRENLKFLGADPDFVVLSRSVLPARRTNKAPFAVGSLALMIFLVVAGIQPIHVAAFTAASVALLSGALTMQEAYRAIEWRAIFLVAAVLPVGIAMETTGAAPWLADTVVYYAESLGPYAVLGMLVVLSSLLSQGLDGAPTVVLLTPVVLQTAQGLGLSPYPMMMGVALAASAAFMTPFSHKANLLVMGAGGYRAMDYVKVGTPLTVVVLALIIFLVPMVFPF